MSVFSPYLATDAHPDTRSLSSILEWPAFLGKKDEALAVALWQWMVDRRIGTYHFLNPAEEPDEPLVGNPVKDPIRLLNSYGYMLCGSHAMVAASILRQAGCRARTTGLTGHNIAEVFYEGGWHLIDVDMHAIHYKRQGDRLVIASAAEACADPDLVANPLKPTDPYYLPDRDGEGTAKSCYAPGVSRPWPGYWYQLHTLDFALRPGETLSYYHQPQGRFHYSPAMVPELKRWHGKSWTGPTERFEPSRTYANACLEYRPALPGDLDAPGVQCNGFAADGDALVASRADNELAIRVISPYVIVGRTPDMARPEHKCDGAILRLSATAEPTVTVRLPLTGMAQTVRADQQDGSWRVDFTNVVDAAYEYELTIRVPAGARIGSLELDTWLQVGPCALPILKPHGTAVTLRLGDHFGGATLPRIVDLIRVAKEGDDAAVRGRLQDDAHFKLVGDDGVELAVVLEAPEGATMSWIKLWAAVQSDEQAARPVKHVELQIAAERGGPWTTLARQPIEPDHERVQISAEALKRFDQPVRKCWVRLISPNDVGQCRAAIHYVPEQSAAPPAGRLTIKHRWRDDGKPREHIETVENPHDGYQYRLDTGNDPQAETTTLSVASTT